MTLNELLGIGAGGLFALLTLVQIVPIKVNPWSWILRAIGRLLNKEVFDLLEKDKAENARNRILRYGDEVRRGENHSKEFADQMMDDVKFYLDFCDTHPKFENGKTPLTCELIKKDYLEHMMKNDFLQ